MPRRSKDDPDNLGGKGVYREDSYIRPRKEDKRPPRDDKQPDTPARGTVKPRALRDRRS